MILPHRPPQFLVIGAQKCGTSWLHHHLSSQPGIWMPPGKELEFFSYASHLEDPGLNAYRAAFEPAGTRIAGEATASYFWTLDDSPWCQPPPGFQADIPGVVREHLGPELRLIVTLRDPVERALSAWGHYLVHGELDPDLPFREAARHGGIVHMGFYGQHLKRWRSRFEADRLLVLFLETDIRTRPAATLRRALAFLGITNISSNDEPVGSPVFPGPERREDEDGGRRIALDGDGAQVRVSAEDLAWLRDLYREDAERLQRWLPPGLSCPWLPGS